MPARANLVALVVAGLVLIVLSTVACGGEEETPNELVIPRSAVEALDNYTFTTDLDLSSAQGDFKASFNGVFQAPDKIQGTLQVSGRLAQAFSALGRPLKTEIILIGEEAWWREIGGDWRSGIHPGEFGEGSADPALLFSLYATPRFYLEGLDFDSLRLSTSGSAETMNNVRAFPVRLDKTGLIGMLDQGMFTKEAGKDVSIVREDAEAFLPEDTVIETWIAEEELYPVRILVTLTADEDNPYASDFFLEKPFDIRLQMDITDPDVDVDIEAPEVSRS